jgi:hypothetical protein
MARLEFSHKSARGRHNLLHLDRGFRGQIEIDEDAGGARIGGEEAVADERVAERCSLDDPRLFGGNVSGVET